MLLLSNRPIFVEHFQPQVMRIFTTVAVIGLSFSYGASYAQVGVNTADPTSTLDVNGTLRVRSMSEAQDVQATKIVGVDEHGNFINLEIGDNIYIDNNVVNYRQKKESIGMVDPFALAKVHNARLVIWPGGTNKERSVIKLPSLVGDMVLTGIDISGAGSTAAAHGKTFWIMAVSGEIELSNEDANSDTVNQFLIASGPGGVKIKQYEMMKVMYDATIGTGIPGRWVVMSKH